MRLKKERAAWLSTQAAGVRLLAALAVTAPHLRVILVAVTHRTYHFIETNDVVHAWGCARDAFFYALSFVACLRKKEAMRMRRRHLQESATVPGALDVHIPVTGLHRMAWTLPR